MYLLLFLYFLFSCYPLEIIKRKEQIKVGRLYLSSVSQSARWAGMHLRWSWWGTAGDLCFFSPGIFEAAHAYLPGQHLWPLYSALRTRAATPAPRQNAHKGFVHKSSLFFHPSPQSSLWLHGPHRCFFTVTFPTSPMVQGRYVLLNISSPFHIGTTAKNVFFALCWLPLLNSSGPWN